MRIRELKLARPLFFALLAIVFGSGPAAIADDATGNQVTKSDVKADKVKAVERDDEYYELLRLFADTLDQIDRNYVKDVSRRDLMEAAIRGMLTKLDQHSNFIPPKDVERFRGSVESEFGGVGIQVSVEEGLLTVISPIVGSPAYKAGLIAGDKILKIEGKTTKDITLDEAVRRMKGKVGTKVTVTVKHPNDPLPKDITIERAIVRVSTVLGDTRKDDDTWNFVYDEEKKIGYIRVTAFSRHTDSELRSAIEQLLSKKMKGLILDLRFNPGGLLSCAIDVCDMFIENGRIVSTEGRNAPERTWDAHKKGTLPKFPMVVLVNRFSASASEIVSACLQDHERAIVVGERTYGKGSVQNIIELEGGKSALKLTTAGYQRPNGKNIHRFDGAKDEDEWGVTPNEGYLLKLSLEQLNKLHMTRRERDIVKKKEKDPEQVDEDPATDDPQLKLALKYLDEQFAKDGTETAKKEPSKEKSEPPKDKDGTAKEKKATP